MKVPEYMRGEELGGGRGLGWVWMWVWVIGVVVGVVGALGWVWVTGARDGGGEGESGGGWGAREERALAAKLLTAGLKEQAVESFGRYLGMGGLGSTEVANVAYLMGRTCMELGRNEEALGHFYRAMIADEGSKAARDARRAEVICLERLGRYVDARYALDRETVLEGRGGTQDVRGVVVARIGEEGITVGDVHDYIQRLPAGEQKRLDSREGREEVLRRLVGEELLFKKGQMAGIDRTAEVRKRVREFERRLVVDQVVRDEVARRVKIDEGEVRKYYEANKGRYVGKGERSGATNAVEAPRFEVVRSEVERAYRAEREAAVIGELVDELMRVYKVEVYPERLEGGR